MKRLRSLLIGLATLALASAAGSAVAAGGIAGSAHDFSGGIATNPDIAPETFTTGTCSFCHTPHKAPNTYLLWNHTISANPSFSWTDVSHTTGGTPYPPFANTYGGPTAKCLSCHDGSVAVGDIAWFGEGKPTSIILDGEEMTTHYHGAGEAVNVGFGGSMNGNHPVAMPYPYSTTMSTYNGVTNGSLGGLNIAEWVPDPTLSGIRLFHEDGGAVVGTPAAGNTGIECSSCHDPHNGPTTTDLFLRGDVGGNGPNYICTKCHIK
jgi:predicted CXXCH cytochrome family protein